ncbi:MAG: hypothetical protein RLZZ297_629, partial [Chloroflexota bacterium]
MTDDRPALSVAEMLAFLTYA